MAGNIEGRRRAPDAEHVDVFQPHAEEAHGLRHAYEHGCVGPHAAVHVTRVAVRRERRGGEIGWRSRGRQRYIHRRRVDVVLEAVVMRSLHHEDAPADGVVGGDDEAALRFTKLACAKTSLRASRSTACECLGLKN